MDIVNIEDYRKKIIANMSERIARMIYRSEKNKFSTDVDPKIVLIHIISLFERRNKNVLMPLMNKWSLESSQKYNQQYFDQIVDYTLLILHNTKKKITENLC